MFGRPKDEGFLFFLCGYFCLKICLQLYSMLDMTLDIFFKLDLKCRLEVVSLLNLDLLFELEKHMI